MRKLLTISPSSVFKDNKIGDVVDIGGKLYVLLQFDPWVVTAVRYYWFDHILGRIHKWRHRKDEDQDNTHRQIDQP
jgi:hypothetical protein